MREEHYCYCLALYQISCGYFLASGISTERGQIPRPHGEDRATGMIGPHWQVGCGLLQGRLKVRWDSNGVDSQEEGLMQS